MGIATVPATGGSGIRSIQRGTATVAGNITITAVDTTKTVVNSFSTSSTGTVAARATFGGTSTFVNNVTQSGATVPSTAVPGDTSNTRTINHASTMSGGTTDITVAEYGVYLLNSTTITATGPCRYEVIEYT
jgi:hypothetical protein